MLALNQLRINIDRRLRNLILNLCLLLIRRNVNWLRLRRIIKTSLRWPIHELLLRAWVVCLALIIKCERCISFIDKGMHAHLLEFKVALIKFVLHVL